MIVPTRTQPKLTARQCLYLTALRDGKKTGKQMRGRLRRWGVRGSNGSFYRVVQRLKRRALIKSKHVGTSKPSYKGQEYYYELTARGFEVAGPKLELLKRGKNGPAEQQWRQQIEQARACLA